MTLSYKLCTEADINSIAELASEIWNEYYPAIIGQHQVDYMFGKMYNAKAIKEQMQSGQIFYLVSYQEKNMAFFSYSIKTEKSGFLHKFYLLKSFRGKAISNQILIFLESLLTKVGIEEYRLTVNRQNAQAINFYFKSGFKIEKVADFDIGNGYFMNDFVMIKNLC